MQATSKRSLRILDFDIENRPLSYLGHDYTTAEVTAIAASFGPKEPMHCWLLGQDEPRDMLLEFVSLYNQADVVTGHYIRRHDLPIINGALLEYQLPPLEAKKVSDTKTDLLRTSDISASQESLSGMLGVKAPKIHMTQPEWRAANRLERLDLTKKRVSGDVRQHQQLRQRLVDLGMLGSPRWWRPSRPPL